jgi:acetyltransferase-like isoleucine patch superfamily enzyme
MYEITINSKIGKNVMIRNFVNIYDSEIGEGTKIASFVEIGGAKIGKNCKFQMGVFIPPGTTIGDGVFLGPHVVICNDKYPRIGRNFENKPVVIKNGASIGANVTILPNITIGENAMVGAGTVVTKDVEKNTIIVNKQEMRIL